MSGASGLDIRLPIGGLFAVLGLLLATYGLATAGETTLYTRSLSLNVNLWWGLVLLLFGLLLLVAALRARRPASARPAAQSPEGQAMEARERQSRLER
jgi:membrane protein implicated in regulation of membrane protease activity